MFRGNEKKMDPVGEFSVRKGLSASRPEGVPPPGVLLSPLICTVHILYLPHSARSNSFASHALSLYLRS